MEPVQRHIPANAFVLYTYDEVSDAIVAAYEGGDTRMRHATRIPLGERLSGWVAATGQTAMNSDARWIAKNRRARARRCARRSWCRSPSTDDAAGVLSFYAENPDAFSDGHRRFVERVSRLIWDTTIELSAAVSPLKSASK